MRSDTATGSDAGEDRATGPTERGARPYLHAMGFIGVLLALMVMVPAWLFAAERTCGCTQPPDLVVVNLDSGPVTVTWRQPGVLGSSLLGQAGSAQVEACSTSNAILPAGRVHVVIDSSTATGAFDLDVPRTFADGPIGWFAVRDGGAVDRIWGSLPDGEGPETTCRT
jgi:hypothetical protein